MGGRVQIVQLIIGGLAQGCIYGLVALSFVLIYKATETVSFAQGDFMMLGAFSGLIALTVMGFPYWLAVVVSVAALGLLGVAVERSIIKPLLGQPAFSIVMLTFGLGYVARALVTMIPGIGTDTHALPAPYKGVVLNFSGFTVGAEHAVVVVATGILCLLLYLMFRYSCLLYTSDAADE